MSEAELGRAAEAVARRFAIDGELIRAEPYGSGHIHDTFCAEFAGGGTIPAARQRAIVQRMNEQIFRDLPGLMENIERVTKHVSAKVADEPDGERRALNLIPTREGGTWLRDEAGGAWRAYRMIERARTVDAVSRPGEAFEAGKAFGNFQRLLADLPAPRLHETIPDFHHTPKRFRALERAIGQDAAGRASTAAAEIGFALAQEPMTRVLLEAGLPERVTHNDTKINNVMLDNASGEGLCVIDLDTAMPGLAPYDFGDMVRTATCRAAEDERDLSRVGMEFALYEALLRGYLSATREFLTEEERELLAFSGRLITFEIGIRFLTDFLQGDRYFKVHREGQNLDRCRTQFALARSIAAQEERMNRLAETLG
ncbi:MAG TPA: aminoglycoside phosphotransferase family protein [Terracidiphilus sp.]|nr:aminoglycoside phosphotransferase family protein [Terracidiphilus sp.]